MEKDNCTTNVTCKAMQNAALRKILEELRNYVELDVASRAYFLDILNSMEEIISVYKCVPCNCLRKRILSLKQKIFKVSIIDVKIFISEIEAFLNSESNLEITITDTSTHKI